MAQLVKRRTHLLLAYLKSPVVFAELGSQIRIEGIVSFLLEATTYEDVDNVSLLMTFKPKP